MDLFQAWLCLHWNGEAPIRKFFLSLVIEILTHVNLLPFSYIFKGKSPYTLKHGKPDHEATDVSVQRKCCLYC